MTGFMENEYRNTLREIVGISEASEARGDRTGVGTFGVFGRQMRCNLGGEFPEFPILTSKKVHLPSIVTELRWFLLGRTDVQYLQERKCTIWNEWATKEACAKYGRAEGDLGPVYGKQWRSFGGQVATMPPPAGDPNLSWKGAPTTYAGGFDQIAWLVNEIQKNPSSRRLIVSGWDPRDAQVVALPPCHTFFQCQVQNKRLSLQCYMRSCDIFLGLPFNLASYGILTHLLARATGTTPGDLVFSFGDLHLYKNHVNQARELLSRTPKSTPKLSIGGGAGDGIAFLESDWFVTLEGYDPHPAIKADVAV